MSDDMSKSNCEIEIGTVFPFVGAPVVRLVNTHQGVTTTISMNLIAANTLLERLEFAIQAAKLGVVTEPTKQEPPQ